jgi:transposase
MPPQYVKAYVKTNKHDAADAEACCEAVQRPSLRFVPVKSENQQATLMLHRVRDQLIGQRTETITRRAGISPSKEHRLGLNKLGDADLRRQLIHGARALVKVSAGRTGKLWSWVNGLRERRPFNVVVAAVANKLARVLWAMLRRGEAYRAA